eukprot:TRINITY_DN4264_c0_g1_i2.p1 TRINITY_DN4264_c0_g1~~TRINITY_DN4264_c0_g1_i2.p1  ORF type:complete len:1541 (+),score=313.05 TRINITY_DN4264_c0_g1_i2:38-4660(+)
MTTAPEHDRAVKVAFAFNSEDYTFEFPLTVTVDGVKTEIFREVPGLKGLSRQDYVLSVSGMPLAIEFIRLVSAHTEIGNAAAKRIPSKINLVHKHNLGVPITSRTPTSSLHASVRLETHNTPTTIDTTMAVTATSKRRQGARNPTSPPTHTTSREAPSMISSSPVDNTVSPYRDTPPSSPNTNNSRRRRGQNRYDPNEPSSPVDAATSFEAILASLPEPRPFAPPAPLVPNGLISFNDTMDDETIHLDEMDRDKHYGEEREEIVFTRLPAYVPEEGDEDMFSFVYNDFSYGLLHPPHSMLPSVYDLPPDIYIPNNKARHTSSPSSPSPWDGDAPRWAPGSPAPRVPTAPPLPPSDLPDLDTPSFHKDTRPPIMAAKEDPSPSPPGVPLYYPTPKEGTPASLPIKIRLPGSPDIVVYASHDLSGHQFRAQVQAQLGSLLEVMRAGAPLLSSTKTVLAGESPIATLWDSIQVQGSSLTRVPDVTLGPVPPGATLTNITVPMGDTLITRTTSQTIDTSAPMKTHITHLHKHPSARHLSASAVPGPQSSSRADGGSASSGSISGGSGRLVLGTQRSAEREWERRQKVLALQIGSLLGRPLCWIADESELKHFRMCMDQLFHLEHLDKRKRIWMEPAALLPPPSSSVSLSSSASSMTPEINSFMPSEFFVKLYFPSSMSARGGEIKFQSKLFVCKWGQTVASLIARGLEVVKNRDPKRTDSVSLKDSGGSVGGGSFLSSHRSPLEYFIKIAGRNEFIFDTHVTLGRVEYIRERIVRKRDVRLSLILRSSIEEDPKRLEQYRPASVELFPISDPFVGNRGCIELENVNRPLEVRIGALEGNLRNIFSATGAHFGSDTLVGVAVGLYHGGELIAPALDSGLQRWNKLAWGDWLRFDFQTHDLPRAARMCFTIYVSNKDKSGDDKATDRRVVGWVNLLMFSHCDRLQMGVRQLNVWPGRKANPTGTCMSNYRDSEPARLTIELYQFPAPVVFRRNSLIDVPFHEPLPNRSDLDVIDYASPRESDKEKIERIMAQDPLYKLTSDDKRLLWTFRYYCRTFPHALPKVLLSVEWTQPAAVREAHRLLIIYPALAPADALELLDAKYGDAVVRHYGVQRLSSLDDETLCGYMLQLTQALKHEPYHDSALARFLLARALSNPPKIGHRFFWHLEAELQMPESNERYSVLLETYLRGCGEARHDLLKETEVVQKLTLVAKTIKAATPASRKQILTEELGKIVFPSVFHLPISGSIEVNGLVLNECKWLDSATCPLWLVFQNTDPAGDPVHVIFKIGDDLRQDILTLQMLWCMDRLWKLDGLDMCLSVYTVVPVSEDAGFIEVVQDAETFANIQKAAGGATAAFSKTPLYNWLCDANPSVDSFDMALHNFTYSLAGYCVATYVLGVGDRHNDNIMITSSGHLFHIDFAHFLGNIMKFAGYKREKAPFVFTPEFAHVLGGEKGHAFYKFTEVCCRAYNVVRQAHSQFITLFALMIDTGIPELTCADDIRYLIDAFSVGLSDDDAAAVFSKLILQSLKTKTTQIMFALHILAHPDKE